MKRTTAAAACAITALIASTTSAVAVQQITGRSVKNGSLTPADLSLAVREDLREPIIVRRAETFLADGDERTRSIDCPIGMVAVGGGTDDWLDEREAIEIGSRPGDDGSWELILLAPTPFPGEGLEMQPTNMFAVCV